MYPDDIDDIEFTDELYCGGDLRPVVLLPEQPAKPNLTDPEAVAKEVAALTGGIGWMNEAKVAKWVLENFSPKVPGFWKRDTPPGFGVGKVCNTKLRADGTCPNAAQHAGA